MKSELQFKPDNDDVIEMPIEIVVSSLSLAEIGAIVCIKSMQHGILEEMAKRGNSQEMKDALASLAKKKVISVVIDNGVIFKINLNPVLPPA